MEEEQNRLRIIDKRNKEKFFVDDEYLNGYARFLGTTSSMVYFVLCRYADKEQSCFPSMDTVGDKIGVKRHTIMRSINTLCEWNIIEKGEQERNNNGKWKHNVYLLLDKSFWNEKPPCSTGATPLPCSTGAPSRVAPDARTVLHPCDIKEPHKKEPHKKEPYREALSSKKTSNRFVKPSFKEIETLFTEKGYKRLAETFYNHYEANGWKIGKVSMRSHTASVAQWCAREGKSANREDTKLLDKYSKYGN